MHGQVVASSLIKPSQVAKLSKGEKKSVASKIEAFNVKGKGLKQALSAAPSYMGGETSTKEIFAKLTQKQRQKQSSKKQQVAAQHPGQHLKHSHLRSAGKCLTKNPNLLLEKFFIIFFLIIK